MSAFSDLGLYADRQPTQYAKARDAYRQPNLTAQVAGKENVIAKNIAQFTGKGDDLNSIEGQTAGIKDMSTAQQLRFHNLDIQNKLYEGNSIGEPLTPEEKQELEQLRKLRNSGMVSSTGTVVAAHGGRIDKPLTGRSRDI